MNIYVRSEANSDFSRARTREKIQKVVNLLKPSRDQMLSLREVTDLLRPSSEAYRGLQVVPVDRIVGSEGRYTDFNKQFLPKHDYLRTRWTRVDEAHLTDITLPPIRVYEIGGVYFVRDGNHRVSVARSQGAMSIDAEVVSLGSVIRLNPDMTSDDLREAVISYEQEGFHRLTRFDKLYPEYNLRFTAPGRYDEILQHVTDHKYYINLNQHEEILFEGALRSWFENVFKPIVREIRKQKMLAKFPGRTEADLYVWLVKHWDALKKQHGGEYPLTEAATDFSFRFGRGFWRQVRDALKARREKRALDRRIRHGKLRPEDLD